MNWNWRKAIGGMSRISITLLVFSFVAQNLASLNKLSLVQLPVGSLLLLILLVIILHDIYRILRWYFIWLKSRKKIGSIVNVIIHLCLYLAVFFVALSVPVPTLPSDQPALPQPVITEKITPIMPDNITVMPGNDITGHLNETVQNTESTDISESEQGNTGSLDKTAQHNPESGADRTYTVTMQDSSSVYASQYMTSPKTVNYEYVLRGTCSQIYYTVYGGMNDHLRSQPRYIIYREGQSPPNDTDFIMRDLNNREQRLLIDPLVKEIQNITSNKDDQARIAVSLVQNMDYDWEGLKSGNIKGKYPYEVLYTDCGVCSEKSGLLAYMLRELGYGVVIFRFEAETHDAVGIKCPQQYSYRDTGYCFVESTSPSIITYSSGDYVVAGNSTSKLTTIPKIIKVCNGDSFDSVSEEYNDAVTWNSIGTGKILDEEIYNEWLFLVNKYGMKTTKD
ncbi:MAG: transglutaminase domain-containing protein [Alphaproteobacteria bacterium]|nr:MAG: transglutaminase domain-containing protein [Alphaproteobacteria bacterium]